MYFCLYFGHTYRLFFATFDPASRLVPTMIQSSYPRPWARRSAAARTTFTMLLLLLACLGLYGLVININPARLQLYLQSIQLEVKDDTVVADVDDNDGDATSSPTYYPTSSTTTAESSSDSKAGDAGVVDGATMATSSPTYYIHRVLLLTFHLIQELVLQ